jgi:hypothetical protein
MSLNQTENLSKKDLIEKLNQISSLYSDVTRIKDEMDYFEPDDNYERKVFLPEFPYIDENGLDFKSIVLHNSPNAVEDMGKLYDSRYQPQKPQEPILPESPKPIDKATAETKKKYGLRIILCIFGGVVGLGGMVGGEPLSIIVSLAILAVCGFFLFDFWRKLSKAKLEDVNSFNALQAQYNDDVTAKKEQYKKDMEIYAESSNTFEEKRNKFLNEYDAWRNVYLQHLDEEDEIENKLEADRASAVHQMYLDEYVPALDKLNDSNDLISEDYLPDLDSIIGLLRTNRADDLKEALNLHEDILYRERQLQLQIEKENNRRYEEELRRQDEERRHQEDIAFRERQEWNRQQEEKDRQRFEERRYQEEKSFRERQERNRQLEAKKLLEEERRKNRAAEASMHKKCIGCANKDKCMYRYSDAAYNCTGFVPG